MTMLEAVDGDRGWRYVDIAEVIETQSPAATADLHELSRRIAFSVIERMATAFDDDQAPRPARSWPDRRAELGYGWTRSPPSRRHPVPRLSARRSSPGRNGRVCRSPRQVADFDRRPR
jgi:hypothetical protein